MRPSDHDLLRHYAHDGSQAAFAELVRRHLDLVYSAARRQVRSSALAEEVAQSVFLDLSRHAPEFKPGMPVVAWLHVVTRRAAIDAIRRESRRQAREQTAVELAAMKPDPPDWSELEPLLDEAMEKLDPTDRAAVLLRYFENKSLREVGEALGASEAAAHKRVHRAIERLRTIVSKRIATASVTSLTANISRYAVHTAPHGLAASLSSSIGLQGLSAANAGALVATKKTASAAAKKILLVAAAAVIVVVGWYQARAIRQQAGEIARLEQLASSWNEGIARARSQRDAARAGAEKTARAAAAEDPALDARLRILTANVGKLKQRLEQKPSEQIPELHFLYDTDWFTLAQQYSPLATEDDYRFALGELRSTAKRRFLVRVRAALEAYLKTTGGVLPADTGLLARFLTPATGVAILQRYEMSASGPVSELPVNKPPQDGNPDNAIVCTIILLEKNSQAIDFSTDRSGQLVLQASGGYLPHLAVPTGGLAPTPENVAFKAAFDQALKGYGDAHDGKEPDDDEPEKLASYFQTPADGERFLQFCSTMRSQQTMEQLAFPLEDAKKAFRLTHNGAEPKDPLELASYFQNAKEGARFYSVWKSQHPDSGK